ncbi:MAG: ATP-binding protein [Calditrichia bacterium]
MKNPFVYGEAVTGENFTNRTAELAELVRDLGSTERIFLISPRRYGKTSLILKALEELKSKGFYTAYIDLYKVTSLHNFLEIYTREIARAVETKTEKMFNFLKKTLPGLRPKISMQPDGSAALGIEYVSQTEEILHFLDEVYDLPQKLAEKKRTPFIIVFDEFQEVVNLNGDSIEKTMRASFQHHDKVGYLFAGSKRHLIYDMVANPDRAFFKMGRIMNLDKLPRDEFIDFIQNAFHKTGFSIEKNTIAGILEMVNDYPHNAQYLCHKLWDDFSEAKRITDADLGPTLLSLLTENTPMYISIWDGLSLHQRRLLFAIAASGGNALYSQDFIRDNNLGSSSSVQTSVRLLMKRQILDKERNSYFIMDIFFKEWIRRKMV